MAGAFSSHSLPEVFCHTGRGSQPVACFQTGTCNQHPKRIGRSQQTLRPDFGQARQSRSGRSLHQVTRAVAEIDRPTASPAGDGSTVTIDNKSDKAYTLVSVETVRQPGLLPALSTMFQDFGVDVVKTTLDGSDSRSHGQFLVQNQAGGKLSDGMEVDRLQRAIESLLDTRFGLKIPRRPQVGGTRDADQRTALLYGLMGEASISACTLTLNPAMKQWVPEYQLHFRPMMPLQGSRSMQSDADNVQTHVAECLSVDCTYRDLATKHGYYC